MTPAEDTLAAQTATVGDLAAKAAGQVETVVAVIRDKTVRPVLTVVNFIVFGFVALFMLLVIVTMFSVATVRLLDVLVFHRHVWASYTVLGGIFSLLGLFLLSRRNAAA